MENESCCIHNHDTVVIFDFSHMHRWENDYRGYQIWWWWHMQSKVCICIAYDVVFSKFLACANPAVAAGIWQYCCSNNNIWSRGSQYKTAFKKKWFQKTFGLVHCQQPGNPSRAARYAIYPWKWQAFRGLVTKWACGGGTKVGTAITIASGIQNQNPE